MKNAGLVMDPGLEILYDDGPCLVVSKPAGLLTQAPPGIDSMAVRVKTFYKKREAKTGKIYLGIPHRLDRPASGAMIFARHVRAARRLSAQFERREVTKIYLACLERTVTPSEGTWENHIRKIPGKAHAEVVDANHPEGRHSVMHYRTLLNDEWGTLLEIQLETGRTHQIRVQASWRGYPILGDEEYGSSVPFGKPFEDQRLRAIALHARSLTFRHPMKQKTVSITAPLPKDWEFAPIDEFLSRRP